MIQFIFCHNIDIMSAHEIKYSQHIHNIINHNVHKLNFFVMRNTISLTAIIPYCSTSSHIKLKRRRKRMTRRCGYLRFRSRVRNLLFEGQIRARSKFATQMPSLQEMGHQRPKKKHWIQWVTLYHLNSVESGKDSIPSRWYKFMTGTSAS